MVSDLMAYAGATRGTARRSMLDRLRDPIKVAVREVFEEEVRGIGQAISRIEDYAQLYERRYRLSRDEMNRDMYIAFRAHQRRLTRDMDDISYMWSCVKRRR